LCWYCWELKPDVVGGPDNGICTACEGGR
jgi:hypothetical protein